MATEFWSWADSIEFLNIPLQTLKSLPLTADQAYKESSVFGNYFKQRYSSNVVAEVESPGFCFSIQQAIESPMSFLLDYWLVEDC